MSDFTNIPFERIVKFGQQTMLDSDLFSVSWILGRFCNYKCSYCWPYANSQTPDHQELSVYVNTINEIRAQASDNGFTKFHWSFSGGEPTAYKHSIELMSKVHYDSIHMTTNLSPGIQWWDRWLHGTQLSRRRSITASYHAEFANEIEFSEKILHLMENGVFVTINQVMVPEQFEELYKRCDRFHQRGINVTLKPQSNEQANKIVDGYNQNMLNVMQTGFPQHSNEEEVLQVRLTDDEGEDWYIDQAERFNAFGFNKFKDWNCNAGFQSCVIRGTEVKRSYSCQDVPLGNILTGFDLFKYSQKCITPICVSSADSKIPKQIKKD